MSVSDAQIIALLQAGKRQGMNALFDRYYKPLVVFADDLLQIYRKLRTRYWSNS